MMLHTKFKRTSLALAPLGLVVLGSLLNANSAVAAALQGRFNLSPQVGSGISLVGVGIVTPTGPLTDLDFLSSDPGDDNPNYILPADPTIPGDAVEVNAAPLDPFDPTSPNDFAPFIGDLGTIEDVLFGVNPDAPATPLPIAAFLDFPGFTFTLNTLSAPIYTASGDDTTISLSVTGIVINKADGSVSTAQGTFSADFTGIPADELQDFLSVPGNQLSPVSFSFDGLAVAIGVPESSNLTGVLMLGLAGGICGIYRKRKQA